MNNKEKIKKDNRKALPLFLLTMLVSLIAGGFVGFFASGAAEKPLLQGIISALNTGFSYLNPWGPAAIIILVIVPCFIILSKAKKQLALWDGEDEYLPEMLDKKLNQVILLSTVAFLFCLLFLSCAINYIDENIVSGSIGTALTLLLLGLSTYCQQKTVDMNRSMNPEKAGSVYDMKFKSKFMNSMDENEKQQCYKAGFSAFRAVNGCCLGLWLVCVVSGLIFHTGLFPMLIVLIIFAVSQISYILSAMKQS